MIEMNEPQQPPYSQQDQQPGNVLETGMPAPEHIDVKWLWDYDYLWLKFEADLRGGKLKRNSRSGNWDIFVPADAKAFMNERGIKDVMALLRANCNVVTGSGIMEADRVKMWCERMQKDLADMLYTHMVEYELPESKFLAVLSTFMLAYESNLSKSIGGKALFYALQAERILETKTITQQSGGSPGFIGKILGR